MKALKNLEESVIYNQRSLKRLVRSVTLSQGQFSLILVCCNYQCLQQKMMLELQKISSVEIQEILLPKSVNTLYTTIDKQLEISAEPSALMIFGLEEVEAIDELLNSTNQVRDEFRKKFCFPLVLWITDELLAKLIRLAPDFKSWAAATIKFELATNELIDFIRLRIDIYLIGWLENKAQTVATFLPAIVVNKLSCFGCEGLCINQRQEIELAIKELKNRDQNLEPILKANIEFILGRDNYCNENIDTAIASYQKSLQLWQGEVSQLCYINQKKSPHSLIINSNFILEQQGVVLYNIGLCYYYKYTQNSLSNCQELRQAKLTLEKSKQIFEEVNRFDLVGLVITALEQVVKQMKDWGELATIAEAGLEIHLRYGNQRQVALDYGFLAEVALQNFNGNQGLKLSKKALNTLLYSKDITLPIEKNYYLLLLAKSLRELGRREAAIEYLEIAEETEKNAVQNGLKNQESRDPKLYIEILTELRSLYYEQGKYLEAFRLKKAQRQIAHQYGLVAFIGASQLQPQKQAYIKKSSDYQNNLPEEITASSRQKDINNLLERMSRDDQKLTIIHGRSGVGKSSLVNAGLVPALNNISISARDTVPIVVQVYTDWLGVLEKCLQKNLKIQGKLPHQTRQKNPTNHQKKVNFNHDYLPKNRDLEAAENQPNLQGKPDKLKEVELSLIKQLKDNAERNLLTIIIFDQFEDFFFTNNTSEKREEFYTFLRDCLNVPFVKVILSMREDYLHYLLECDFINYLDIINNNILDKQNRYHLKDFSREDAYKIIECLITRAKLNLEPKLIDAIVDGLADEKQQIRPIELQVVGSQLQEEEPPIQTLAQFEEKFGSNPQKAKQKIVRNFLEQVITDCGKENEEATMEILFALTNENLTRPSRTKQELSEIIWNFTRPTFSGQENSEIFLITKLNQTNQANTDNQNLLELILEILIDSGLLFVRKEASESHYQLVHDYLVKPIRKRFNLEERLRQAEAEITESEKAKKQAEAEKKISQTKLNLVLKQQLAAAIIGIIFMSISTITTYGFWQRTEIQKKLAEAQRERADINSMTAVSEALFFSNYKFDALIESLRAGKKWKKIKQSVGENHLSYDTEYRIAASLQQAIYGVKEHNQLEAHGDVIWSVTFHPQGNLIASASVDKTIKLWSRDGKLQKTLKGHTESVSRVSFSPDGKNLASASHDRTVKIWNLQQQKIKPLSLKGHTDWVTTVNFSPDSKILASGSLDKTIKIWSTTGILLKTINTKAAVNWVSFSPDGQIIAAATENGSTQLWNLNGQLLAILEHRNRNNDDTVYSVNFSPDGRSLVTASADKTLKVWRLSGNTAILETTLIGHKKLVLSASFSPDGKTIASSSADNTIKIWSRDGTLLNTFSGHGDKITQVSFSPDGQTLASASYDKTIKLWSLKSSSLDILRGHQHRVMGVSFSADGQILASASQDKTIKLWSRTGKLLKTLRGHTNRVASLSFSPDGQILASGSYDNTVKLWYLNSPEKVWNLELLDSTRNWRQDLHHNQNHRLFYPNSGETISYIFSKLKLTESANTKKLRDCQVLGEKHLMAVFSGFCQEYAFVNSFATKFICLVRVGNLCLVAFKFSPLLPQLNLLRQYQSVEERKGREVELQITLGSQPKVATKLGCFPMDIETVCSDMNWNWKASYNPTDKNIDLIGHTDSVMSVSFSPNSQIIASGSKDKTVKLWNRKGKLLKTLVGHQGWVNSVSFSPNGKMLASASDDGTVKIWSQDGVLIRTINAHNNWVLGVSFSPDGQAIATASYDNTVKLWSVTGKLLKTFLKGSSDSVTSVSFSPNGQIIASSSYDGKVKLWSLYDGTLLKSLMGHGDSVMSVSFSPDGKFLASGSRDKTVILWNLALDDLLERGCSWVGDYLRTNPNVSDSDRRLCDNLDESQKLKVKNHRVFDESQKLKVKS